MPKIVPFDQDKQTIAMQLGVALISQRLDVKLDQSFIDDWLPRFAVQCKNCDTWNNPLHATCQMCSGEMQ